MQDVSHGHAHAAAWMLILHGPVDFRINIHTERRDIYGYRRACSYVTNREKPQEINPPHIQTGYT